MWRGLLVCLVAVAAGCAAPADHGDAAAPSSSVPLEPVEDAGGFAPCHGDNTQPVAWGVEARSELGPSGLAPGIHPLGESAVLWVWAAHEETLREDRISRINEARMFRELDGSHSLCTRVEILAPLEGDGTRRTYDVAVRFEAPGGFPEGELRVVVNWVASCRTCEALPSGNSTAILGRR